MKMKYIAFRDERTDLETAVMFSDTIVHADMARYLRRLGEPVGAGFCYANEDGKITAYGRSDSLGVESRDERDGDLLSGPYF